MDIYGDIYIYSGDFMVIWWILMAFNGDLMVFNGDLMVI